MLCKLFQRSKKSQQLSKQSQSPQTQQSTQQSQQSQPSPSPSQYNKKKHYLFCEVNGYTDMAHYLHHMKFRNNTKYLYNFDAIKKDIEDYFYSNMYIYIHVVHNTTNGITTRHFDLINPNKNTSELSLEYKDVIVLIKIKWL